MKPERENDDRSRGNDLVVEWIPDVIPVQNYLYLVRPPRSSTLVSESYLSNGPLSTKKMDKYLPETQSLPRSCSALLVT